MYDCRPTSQPQVVAEMRVVHTDDRLAITRWFAEGHRTSPVTNMCLPNLSLAPNHALRNAIRDSAPQRKREIVRASEVRASAERTRTMDVVGIASDVTKFALKAAEGDGALQLTGWAPKPVVHT